MALYLPKCAACGGDLPFVRLPHSFRQAMWGGWTCASCGAELNRRGKIIPGGKPSPPLAVTFSPELRRIRAATERIFVPVGVNMKLKRMRTIQRTVEVSEKVREGTSLGIGVEKIFTQTIRNEVERQRGVSYQETETVEHEMSFAGVDGQVYELIWTDLWQEGIVRVGDGKNAAEIPFRLRMNSELTVCPVSADSIE